MTLLGGGQFDVITSLKACFNTYMSIRREIKIGLLILGIIAIVLYIKKNTTKHIIKNLFIHKRFGILILSAFTVGIYLILLDAYTTNAVHYLSRQDVYNTLLFYPGIILLMGVRYVIKNMRAAYCVMPILIYIMMFQSVFHSSIFYHYRNNMNMKNFECEVVQEMIEADQNGMKELQIITTRELVDEASKPWLEERIPDVLYRYGIVYDWITLEFVYE